MVDKSSMLQASLERGSQHSKDENTQDEKLGRTNRITAKGTRC